MAKKRISDVLIDVLANAGIERIYGITGDSLNSVNDSLRCHGKIAFEHVRHEETAAFAAGAEAALTHKLTVCAGSSGPGNFTLDQRFIRLSSQSCSSIGYCVSYSAIRSRLKLLPRNTSRKLIQRMFLFL